MGPIRSVVTFALDDSDPKKDFHSPPKAPPVNAAPRTGPSSRTATDTVSLCVIRERHIALYNLNQRITPVTVPIHAISLFSLTNVFQIAGDPSAAAHDS